MIVGAGYHGILTSDSTRIRGLVSLADLAPTAVALQEGRSPPIHSEPDPNAVEDLGALDARLSRVHHDRGWVGRHRRAHDPGAGRLRPRAAALGGAAAVTASLLLSWAGATRFGLVIAAMAALTVVLSVAGSLRRRIVPATVAVFLVALTIVLAIDPELNSLGVLGARPDGGGRFYGVGNQVRDAPPAPRPGRCRDRRHALARSASGARARGDRLEQGRSGRRGHPRLRDCTRRAWASTPWASRSPPRRLALVACGRPRRGLRVRRARCRSRRFEPRHPARSAGGPGSLLGDLGHRLHLSWLSATDHWYRILIFLACLAALVLMGTMRPRRATVARTSRGPGGLALVNDTLGRRDRARRAWLLGSRPLGVSRLAPDAPEAP